MERRTHYVAPFTRRDHAGRERAVCGEWVVAQQLAPKETEPTCWGCAMYVNNLDAIETPEPARVLARIMPETPWGEPTKEVA